MAENMQKIKLLKLYELLRKETDIDHPISRVELCICQICTGMTATTDSSSLASYAMIPALHLKQRRFF